MRDADSGWAAAARTSTVERPGVVSRDEPSAVDASLGIGDQADRLIAVERRAHGRHVARSHADSRRAPRSPGRSSGGSTLIAIGGGTASARPAMVDCQNRSNAALSCGAKPPRVHRAGQQQPAVAPRHRHDHRQRPGRIGVRHARDHLGARRQRAHHEQLRRPQRRGGRCHRQRRGLFEQAFRKVRLKPDTTGTRSRAAGPGDQIARGARVDALVRHDDHGAAALAHEAIERAARRRPTDDRDRRRSRRRIASRRGSPGGTAPPVCAETPREMSSGSPPETAGPPPAHAAGTSSPTMAADRRTRRAAARAGRRRRRRRRSG